MAASACSTNMSSIFTTAWNSAHASASHGAVPLTAEGRRPLTLSALTSVQFCRNRKRSRAFSQRDARFKLAWFIYLIEEMNMGNLLHYALVFLVIALIAAAVGFGGLAGVAMESARLLFWVFIVLFVVSLVAGLVRRV